MEGIEVVAINDLTSPKVLGHLLKYDSAQGRFGQDVTNTEDSIVVNGEAIKIYAQKDPSQIPWGSHDVDVVLECTGFFTDKIKAEAHLKAGAKRVVISAPATGDLKTIVFNVNHNILDGSETIISCASCTTNNIAPVMEIIDRRIGIKKAILNTVHAYTASQSLMDASSKKKLRMGRSAAVNLIPSSTGAAVAAVKALPQLERKFDGISIRTPVAVGSISDITLVAARNTTSEEINNILSQESKTDRYKLILSVSSEPLVSSDIVQSPFASIVDLEMTRVVDKDLVKIMVWYDNEWGFTNQMIRELQKI